MRSIRAHVRTPRPVYSIFTVLPAAGVTQAISQEVSQPRPAVYMLAMSFLASCLVRVVRT